MHVWHSQEAPGLGAGDLAGAGELLRMQAMTLGARRAMGEMTAPLSKLEGVA